PGGLRDLQVVDAGRKQLRTARERLESENLRLVPARWAVLDALLVEAQERAGTPQPGHDYLRVRPQFTTEPAAPPAEPVSPRARRRGDPRPVRPFRGAARGRARPHPGGGPQSSTIIPSRAHSRVMSERWRSGSAPR